MRVSIIKPCLPMGIAELNSVTGSSTISKQLVAGYIIATHIKSISVPSLPLRVYGPIRATQRVSQGFETTLCRYFTIIILMPFVDLAFMTLFDVGLERSCKSLFKTCCSWMLQVVVHSTACCCSSRGMTSLSFLQRT